MFLRVWQVITTNYYNGGIESNGEYVFCLFIGIVPPYL